MRPSGTGVGDSLGSVRPDSRLPGDGHLCLFCGSTDDAGFVLFLFFLDSESSEGLHSVSSRDNAMSSVTTVGITEHNGGRAAVMPA